MESDTGQLKEREDGKEGNTKDNKEEDQVESGWKASKEKPRYIRRQEGSENYMSVAKSPDITCTLDQILKVYILVL